MKANRFLPQALLVMGVVCMSIGQGLAATISLDLPVRCDMGKVCFVQNYVDHDPSPAYQDFACGYLTYNEHAGTDFRVIDEVAMALATPVVAAAPGTVIGVRDGEPDVAVSVRGRANLGGLDAGNGVVIDHGNGWQTQYSHLRKGSVLVTKGQRVARGDALGMIGESGNADFPHVDFSVRYEGKVVDPFQPKADATCSTDIAKDSLWSDSARKALAYVPSAILQAGFADHIPSRLEAQSGKLTQAMLRTDAPQLVFWVQLMGVRNGDEWQMQVTGPNGKLFVSGSDKIYGNKAVWVGGVGKRRGNSPWPLGQYVGSVKLIRGGKPLLTRQAAVLVQD